MQEEKLRPDPYKVFKAIGEIVAKREGVRIVLKSVREKDDNQAKTA